MRIGSDRVIPTLQNYRHHLNLSIIKRQAARAILRLAENNDRMEITVCTIPAGRAYENQSIIHRSRQFVFSPKMPLVSHKNHPIFKINPARWVNTPILPQKSKCCSPPAPFLLIHYDFRCQFRFKRKGAGGKSRQSLPFFSLSRSRTTPYAWSTSISMERIICSYSSLSLCTLSTSGLISHRI